MVWNDNMEKRTLREEWRLIWRGVKILNEILPHYWLYQVLCTITETFRHTSAFICPRSW